MMLDIYIGSYSSKKIVIFNLISPHFQSNYQGYFYQAFTNVNNELSHSNLLLLQLLKTSKNFISLTKRI